jgi:DNA-binding NarL/FixJ family response regulator
MTGPMRPVRPVSRPLGSALPATSLSTGPLAGAAARAQTAPPAHAAQPDAAVAGPSARAQRLPVTVLVVDDSPLAREGLRRGVAAVPGVDRVITAASGEEALVRWAAEQPALTLLDVRMPGLGGIEAARRLLSAHPEAEVLVLTMAEDVEGVSRAVAAGASGYLVKDASREELAAAVTAVLGRARAAESTGSRPAGTAPVLTERELQVLRGMARGRSNGEIGRELYLSEDTVKTHARRLFRKLAAADRAQAVAVGFRWGLVR